MKRAIIAVIILASVTVLAITVNFTLTKKAETLYTLAQSAMYNKAALEDFDTEWNQQIIYFELFVDHSYFEMIDKKIKKLSHIESEQYFITCTEAMVDIAALKEHISFSFGNIF